MDSAAIEGLIRQLDPAEQADLRRRLGWGEVTGAPVVGSTPPEAPGFDPHLLDTSWSAVEDEDPAESALAPPSALAAGAAVAVATAAATAEPTAEPSPAEPVADPAGDAPEGRGPDLEEILALNTAPPVDDGRVDEYERSILEAASTPSKGPASEAPSLVAREDGLSARLGQRAAPRPSGEGDLDDLMADFLPPGGTEPPSATTSDAAATPPAGSAPAETPVPLADPFAEAAADLDVPVAAASAPAEAPAEALSFDPLQGSATETPGFDPLGAPAAETPGFDPLGAPAAEPSGFDSLGAPAAEPSGFDSLGAPAAETPGFDPLGVPAAETPGFDPLGAPAAETPGFDPLGASATETSGFDPLGTSDAGPPDLVASEPAGAEPAPGGGLFGLTEDNAGPGPTPAAADALLGFGDPAPDPEVEEWGTGSIEAGPASAPPADPAPTPPPETDAIEIAAGAAGNPPAPPPGDAHAALDGLFGGPSAPAPPDPGEHFDPLLADEDPGLDAFAGLDEISPEPVTEIPGRPLRPGPPLSAAAPFADDPLSAGVSGDEAAPVTPAPGRPIALFESPEAPAADPLGLAPAAPSGPPPADPAGLTPATPAPDDDENVLDQLFGPVSDSAPAQAPAPAPAPDEATFPFAGTPGPGPELTPAPAETPAPTPVLDGVAPAAPAAPASGGVTTWEEDFHELFRGARGQCEALADDQILGELSRALAEVRKAAE